MPKFRKGDLIGFAVQDFLTKAGQGLSTGFGQAQERERLQNILSQGDPFARGNIPDVSMLDPQNVNLLSLMQQSERQRAQDERQRMLDARPDVKFFGDPEKGIMATTTGPDGQIGVSQVSSPRPGSKESLLRTETVTRNGVTKLFDVYGHKNADGGETITNRKPHDFTPSASQGGNKSVTPSSADASFITSHSLLLNSVSEIEGVISKNANWSDWVGPVAGRVADLQSAANQLPAEQERFRATVAEIRNKFLNVLSGAAISPAEAERLMEQLPTTTDSPTAFQEKVKKTKENLEFILREYQKARKLGGEGGDQFDVGEVYIDASGNRAKYLGNGNWEDQ